MKRISRILMLLLVVIVYNAYSQSVIQDSIKIDFATAKKIKIDLNDYDRLIESKVEESLRLSVRLNREKDSIIEAIRKRAVLVEEKEEIHLLQQRLLSNQLKNSKKHRRKNTAVWIAIGFTAGITTGVAIIN